MTTVKQAYQLIKKAARLMEILQERCFEDENRHACGWELDAQGRETRWVAWAMLLPECEPMIFDGSRTGEKSGSIADLDELELDRLLRLKWKTSKPIGPLDMLARAASAGSRSGLPDAEQHHDAPGHDVTMSASGAVMSVRRIDPTDGSPL